MKMIKIPLSQIIETIKSKANISEDEIRDRIRQKTEQLSGLISEEGAAHIIANELGIRILEQSGKLKIKNVLVGMRSVEVLGKVTKLFEVREFKKDDRTGKVGSFIIGDETGSIRITCWGSQADSIRDISEGDTVKIISGYVKENNNLKEIHLNHNSRLVINPPGETVEIVASKGTERKKIDELKEGDINVEIMGYITQSFDIRFFEVCPQCSKRAKRIDETGFVCERCGKITPAYSYVFNAVVDDGSSTIRTVFFGKRLEQLLGKNPEEIVIFRENLASFDDIKHELLGKPVKIVGNTKKNTLFDRLEFVANEVVNPNPDDELKSISSGTEKDIVA